MHSRRWYWMWGLVGACAGFVVGVDVEHASMRSEYRPLVEELGLSPYAAATSVVSVDTRALKKLRTDAVDDAANILEEDLDRNLSLLGSYDANVPVDRRSNYTYYFLGQAAAYRRQYPRPPRVAPEGHAVEAKAFDARIAEALALGTRYSQKRGAP